MNYAKRLSLKTTTISLAFAVIFFFMVVYYAYGAYNKALNDLDAMLTAQSVP